MLTLRHVLTSHELPVFVQTTGSRGLHLVVPLDGSAGFNPVCAFAHKIALKVAADAPGVATLEQRKSARGARFFIDIMRNAYAQTAVAPYAVRA